MSVEYDAYPRAAVIGSGSMGSLFAARLSLVADVTMVGSWSAQIQAINEKGLMLISPGGKSSRYSFRAVLDAKEVEPAAYALVLVKGWQTERAAETARQVMAENGLALTLQNGIGNLEKIVKVVGRRRSALGVTSDGATLVEPGIVRHAGHGITHIAAAPETADRMLLMTDLLARAGFDARLAADADSLVWGKLAVNAGINPLTGLLQKPNGFLVENKTARQLMESAALETAQVAEAQGITLPFPNAAQRALQVARETATNYSSMAQDVSRGTPTEIESITGAVVDLGHKFGVATPINEALLLLMRRLIHLGEWQSSVSQLPESIRGKFRRLINIY